MPDWTILGTIVALGIVSYALRAGGYLAAGTLREEGELARFLRLAPGNLFIAFVAAGCLEGGWPSVVGCGAAFAAMTATRKEWLALGVGFASAVVTAAWLSR